MPNLSRGIMLEGISCAGKTSTMYAIKRLFASDLNLERNIIMLGEHYSQVLNEIDGELRYHEQSEHTEMLFQRVKMIEQLHAWALSLGDFRRTSRGLYTVFERGFINHIAFYQDFEQPSIIELAERFSRLGIESILLVISGERLEERIRLRDRQMNLENTRSYYREQVKTATERQEKMIEASKKTTLPSRIITTDSMNWDEYAKIILAI